MENLKTISCVHGKGKLINIVQHIYYITYITLFKCLLQYIYIYIYIYIFFLGGKATGFMGVVIYI